MGSFFANPWMLAGIVAVTLPIIIEWLFKRRKRQIDLPTIRFLLRSKEQEKIKRQDRILLILRMVGIGLLTFAVARPLIQHGLVGGARQRHVIVLLDGTASMSQQVGVTTAFGMAQKKAAGMVRELPKGTIVSVGLLGHRAEGVVEQEKDVHTAAGRIEALRAGAGAASITDGIAWVRELLDRASEGRPELYVFSDFQKHTWLGGGGRAAETARALNDISAKCECYMVDVGGEPKFNYMLTDLQPEDRLMSTGLPVRFRARVELWGKPPEGSAASVAFVVDGAKKDVREVRVSDGSASLVFEHRFAKAGEHLVEAVLEGDEHRVDNRRMYLCSVPESVPVLILDETAPEESGGTAGSAPEAADRVGGRLADRLDFQSAYLARAIAPPTHPAAERVSRFSAKAVPVSRIDYENLDNYSAVALMDCGNLSEAAAAKLETYAADGGTLWIFLGPRVNAYQYNRFLWKDGRGLLPCRIKDAAPIASPDPKEAPHIKFGESTHPALTELAGLGSPDAKVLRYMNLETEGGGRTVAALSNGTPAIIEKDVGRGKVILVNTTAGVEWTMLPATMEFAIMVQDMLRYSIGNPDAMVNLNVGDVFEEPVFVTAQHLLLRCPDGRKERLTPRKREDRAAAWTVAFSGTRQQGIYEFMDVSREVLPRLRFVVNQKPEEGDLSRLSRGDFAQAFGSGAWRWIGPETPVEEFVAKLHSVTELAPGVLAALLAVLAVESYLAARFGRRRGGTTT